MATEYRVGVIGCGRKPGPGPDGRMRGGGIAESPARASEAFGRTRLVAAPDISHENLASYVERHPVSAAMLRRLESMSRIFTSGWS